ncbi:MAG TPA: N-acetylmuramoyl-L-alanine amidase [Thermoanaerobaculia bacterium]|nr:N-acetylmuramoyl-L-alanine amidase [Thermoanaerobaculia bacterium]
MNVAMRASARVASALVLLLALPGAADPASSKPPSRPAKAAPAPPAAPRARSFRAVVGEGLTAFLAEDQTISLEATPKPGEGLLAFTRRVCGDERGADQVANANGGSRDLRSGVRYSIALDVVDAETRIKALKALFPDDRAEADGWVHKVRGTGALERESLWHVASWFTGNGENFRALREFNELHDDELARGASLAIPAELLLPEIRAALPKSTGFRLDYGKDASGDYALYRLRPGEALYSAVVVRFTGRIHGADVNALAAQLAERSGIPDVTDIPAGFRVKIPFDLLQPEFLPPGNPRRLAYEAEVRESEKFTNQIRAQGLSGITVILDAGHGGRDSGASMGSVWESLYVYDIVMRTKRLLESRTGARVVVTTRDGGDFKIYDADVLPFSRGHAVLTTPPYPIEDPVVGVNLRWYLANSIYRQAVHRSEDEEKVVFLSVHADSLHPSLRGAMAYIPAASMGEDTYGKSGAVYAAFREVRENPFVNLPRERRTMAEGLSRELARAVIAGFESEKLAVHPDKPVREKVIRNQSEWVPAVLRYNAVPAKLLLEVCNLGNEEDRRLIQTRSYREDVAAAIVKGLLAYYDEADSGKPPAQIAKTK